MKESSILDLGFGFYVKNYPYGQSPKSKLADPGQNLRTHVSKKVFVIPKACGLMPPAPIWNVQRIADSRSRGVRCAGCGLILCKHSGLREMAVCRWRFGVCSLCIAGFLFALFFVFIAYLYYIFLLHISVAYLYCISILHISVAVLLSFVA